MRRAADANRLCCDGACTQGRACPALLAPGVVDGPHRRRGTRTRRGVRLLVVSVALGLTGYVLLTLQGSPT